MPLDVPMLVGKLCSLGGSLILKGQVKAQCTLWHFKLTLDRAAHVCPTPSLHLLLLTSQIPPQRCISSRHPFLPAASRFTLLFVCGGTPEC